MQSHDNYGDYERPTNAYVRRRLAEATLLQDEHDGSSWKQLDPGPPVVQSIAHGAQSLHDGLLGNAWRHVQRYMSTETNSLAIGHALEAEIDPEYDWPVRGIATASQDPPGYMERPSAFEPLSQGRVDETMEMTNEAQMATMSPALPPKKTATIIYYGDGNELTSLHNVDFEAVEDRCPLLAMAFEESRSGPQLFLESLSSRTAEPFLRFLNTGTYAGPSEEWNSGGAFEDVPTSVLFHCEMYRLGDIYDLPELKSLAYVNVLRQCEFGCSSPDKPIDLCAGIRFLYAHLKNEEQLIDAVIHYCVACFLRHRLGEDLEFKQLAYDLRPFHQDLCKNCMNRDFENETAAAIIQMPFEPHRPEIFASTEHRRFMDDVIYQFHAEDDIDASPKKRKRPSEETVLPIRGAQSAQVKEEPVDQDGGPSALLEALRKNKRCASSAVLVENPFSDVKKEEDFEEIDLRRGPSTSSESDSESFEWVEALPERSRGREDTSTRILTVRNPGQAPHAEGGGSESDSDWSLV